MERVDRSSSLPDRIGPRAVLSLAWPIIVSMLSYTAMSTADAIFLGRLGTAPLAAIGVALSVLFLIRAMGHGLLEGLRTVTAQATGAGDYDAAGRFGWQGLWLAGLLGALSVACIPLCRPIFGWMGTPSEVTELAEVYATIRLFGSPMSFGLFALTAWFQGRGDTRTPMVATVGANVLNVALDPVFIFGWGPVPALGIGGAALSTVLSLTAGVAFLAWRFRAERLGVSFWPDRSLLREVWRIGSPLGVRELLEVGSYAVFIAILANAGEAHLAAHVVMIRIICISFLPGYGIANAAGVLVGQSVGARRPESAGQAVRAGLVLAIGIMVASAVVFVAIPGALVSIFGVTPEVAVIAVQLIYIAAAFQLFDAVATVLFCALNGAGDTRYVMWAGVGVAWLVKLPVGWLFAVGFGLGAPGAWLGFTAELIVLAVLFSLRVRSGKWLVLPSEEPASGPVPAK